MTAGSSLVEIEALADFKAELLQLRDDRLVGDVGRVQLQQLGRVGEKLARRHLVDGELRRRLHVDGRIEPEGGRDRFLTPLRQRRNLIAILDLVNRIVVGGPVGLGAANDPDIGRRRFDLGEVGGNRSAPAWRRHQKISRLRSGRAPAR